jgi:hypothetical protein
MSGMRVRHGRLIREQVSVSVGPAALCRSGEIFIVFHFDIVLLLMLQSVGCSRR